MSLDTILWFAGTAGEVGVIALLLYRRIWRSFPIFFSYSIWTFTYSAVGYVLYRKGFNGYATVYLVDVVIDSALLFGVLVELAWSILRPLRLAPSRRLLFIIACLIIVLGSVIWPFASVTISSRTAPQILLIMHIQQTFYVLRVLVFLALVASSQLLAIGWRNRELQIASGLGFTSLVSLIVAMLHAYPSMRVHYDHLNEIVVGSYLFSLLYWIFSFSQQEEKRREFSPQMQNLLLAVAGAARTTRIALSDSGASKTLEKTKR